MSLGVTLQSIRTGSSYNWEKNVGCLHWRNNIILHAGSGFVGTCGTTWNKPDEEDGVVRFDLATGEIVWAAATGSDVNEIALADDLVLGGTDEGKCFAFDASDGKLQGEYYADASVTTAPVEVTVRGKTADLFVSSAGELILFERDSRSFRLVGKVEGVFRTRPILAQTPAGPRVILANDDGEIYTVCLDDAQQAELVYSIKLGRDVIFKKPLQHRLTFVSSLLQFENTLVVSYGRDTAGANPPMLALSMSDWSLLWEARAVKTVSKNPHFYGNARGLPVVWRGLILATFSYTDSLYAFSVRTGRGEWKTKLDQGQFQNWASPVLHGSDFLYVARTAGLLAKVDLRSHKVIKSISIETPSDLDLGYLDHEMETGYETWPHFRSDSPDGSGPLPRQPLAAGLAATPASFAGGIIVGTVSGRLISVRDPVRSTI